MYIFFDREADVKYKLLLHMEQEITERYEHLEEQFGISRKTLLKYLTLLDRDFEGTENRTRLIFSSESVVLNATSEFSVKKMMLQYVYSSLKFKLVDFSYRGTGGKLKFMLRENISESTYYRLIRNVNDTVLAQFKVKIDANLSMIGKEHQIRYFYYCLYQNLNNDEKNNDNQEYSPMLDAWETVLNVKISNPSSRGMFFLMDEIAKIRRERAAGIFEVTHDMKKLTRNNNLFQELSSLMENNYEKIKRKGWLEDAYISFCIVSSAAVLDETIIPHLKLYQEHENNKNSFYMYVEKFIYSIQKHIPNFKIDSSVKETLLQFYCRVLIFEGYFYENNEEFYWEYVKNERSFLCEVLKLVYQDLLDYFKKEDEKVFITFHAIILDNILTYSEMIPSVNIGIDSSRDRILVTFYSKKLEAYLSNDYRVNIQPYTEKNAYDIVLSDRKNKHENTFVTYSLGSFPNITQVKQIKKLLKKATGF